MGDLVRSGMRAVAAMIGVVLIAAGNCVDGSAAADAQLPSPPLPGFDIPVLPAFGLRAVDAGSFHTCGIDRENRVWCWGLDDRGQLGQVVPIGLSRSPVRVGNSFTRYRAVSAGGSPVARTDKAGNQTYDSHSCAVTLEGSVECWGANGFGQLGNGGVDDSASPVPIIDVGRRFVDVSAGGRHTCAVTEDLEVFCWGDNLTGQLGAVTEARRSGPVRASGSLQYSSVSAGDAFTCASYWYQTHCWGLNTRGQLGLGGVTAGTRWSIEALFVGVYVGYVSAGLEHACGLNESEEAVCWGRADEQQLGFRPAEFCGSVLCSAVPLRVVGSFTFRQVSAGGLHTCGLTQKNEVICWGRNVQGQLGIGLRPEMPALLPAEPAWLFGDMVLPGRPGTTLRVAWGGRQVSAGGIHSCAIAENSQPFCWGGNVSGQVGAGTDVRIHDRPVAIEP